MSDRFTVADQASDRSDVHGDDGDSQLVIRASAGDRAAVAELYRRHAATALRAAYSVARNRHDAEDAASEAFARVIARVMTPGLASAVPFRPYLLRACRNAAIDVRRDAARCSPTGDVRGHDGPDQGDQPGDRLIGGAEHDLVDRLLRELPPRWRMVLSLTEIRGMATREAAPLLGLSANGTAQLAVRSRAGLRARLLRAGRDTPR